MTDNDIKNRFIVNEDTYNRAWAKKIAEKALIFAKVSENGKVFIEVSNLLPDYKLKLVLVVRFIAHSFDANISKSVKVSELKDILANETNNAIGSRMSQIAKSGFSKKDGGAGRYSVHPYKIEGFLQELETIQAQPEKLKKGVIYKKRTGGMSKISKDIMSLIEIGFFKTPKTIQEAKSKLEEEVKFYDIRSIDTTIRKQFVKNNKTLKRLPHEGKGKTKWHYVIR